MSKHDYRSEPVRFSDKSTILHSAFGLREVEATLPDGSKGRAVDEDRGEAEARAHFNALSDQARKSD